MLNRKFDITADNRCRNFCNLTVCRINIAGKNVAAFKISRYGNTNGNGTRRLNFYTVLSCCYVIDCGVNLTELSVYKLNRLTVKDLCNLDFNVILKLIVINDFNPGFIINKFFEFLQLRIMYKCGFLTPLSLLWVQE